MSRLSLHALSRAWRALAITTSDRYIAAIVLRAYLLAAAALVALFSLLEFVEQLGSVGEGHYQLANAALYTLYTMPYRLLQVTPVAMLMGCLLGFGGLARHSELMALHSLGKSEYRIISVVMRLTILVWLLLFLLAEYGIPITQQLAQQEHSAALSTAQRREDSFWAAGNHQYLNVQHFERRDTPNDIDIYSFNADGTLAEYLHADHAGLSPGGHWLLADVTRKRLQGSQFQVEHLAALDWQSFLSPRQMQLLRLPADSMPPIALYHYIRSLRQQHLQAPRYEQEFWTKVSLPFSTLAMIMVSAPFVFGPPRAQNTGSQIAIGVGFGAVFSLVQGIVGSLNLLLDLNPAVAALAPSVLLMILAARLFRRTLR